MPEPAKRRALLQEPPMVRRVGLRRDSYLFGRSWGHITRFRMCTVHDGADAQIISAVQPEPAKRRSLLQEPPMPEPAKRRALLQEPPMPEPAK